jgi:hypothetical protein
MIKSVLMAGLLVAAGMTYAAADETVVEHHGAPGVTVEHPGVTVEKRTEGCESKTVHKEGPGESKTVHKSNC